MTEWVQAQWPHPGPGGGGIWDPQEDLLYLLRGVGRGGYFTMLQGSSITDDSPDPVAAYRDAAVCGKTAPLARKPFSAILTCIEAVSDKA